jgi:tubulin-specific chaperone D
MLLMVQLIRNILDLNDVDAVDVASIAAADLMLLIDNLHHGRSDTIWEFAKRAKTTIKGGRNNQGKSYIHALFRIFPLTDDMATLKPDDDTYIHPRPADLIATFHTRWTEFHEIEIRATILSCLANSSALHTHTNHFVNMIGEGLDDFTTNARGDVGSLVRVEATKAAGAIWADHVILNEIKLDAYNQLFGKVIRAAAEKLDRVRIEGQKAVASALYERPRNFSPLVSSTSEFKTLSTSSKDYFLFLLELQTGDWLAHGPPHRVESADWARQFMEGYITSADTGAEDLVRASRAALAEFCEAGKGTTETVYSALIRILEKQLPTPNEDRVVVPCLEIISFLFDAGLLQLISFE